LKIESNIHLTSQHLEI